MRARLLLLLLIAWSPVGAVQGQPAQAPSAPAQPPAGAEPAPKQPRAAPKGPPEAPAAPKAKAAPPAEAPKASAAKAKPPSAKPPATPTPAEAAPAAAAGEATEQGLEEAPAEPAAAEADAAGAAQAETSVEAEPPEVEAAASAEAQAPALEPTLPPAVPSPAELEERLAEDFPEGLETDAAWTAPVPVLTLHGYMRVRAEMMDSFFLGREQLDVFRANPDNREFRRGQGPDPFSRFRPIERRINSQTLEGPAVGNPGYCVDESTNNNGTCDIDSLQFMNMRLRLSPQINLSEDVRVKTTFDVFDNLVAGEPPASYYGGGTDPDTDVARANTTVFAGTDTPPSGGGLSDSIVARRAWAEVRNRDLGELRFGRMPQHWGLGMYYNAGDEIDQDFSTDLDRVLAITKIFGLYLSFSYDFIAEGFIDPGVEDRPDVDASQLDDVDQFTFSVARKHSPEEEAADIERGDVVLNGGLQFQIRNQDSLFEYDDLADEVALRRVEATHYTLDLWGKFHWRGVRSELEAVWVTGSMHNVVTDSGSYDINQFGYALENEFRLLDDKLALYFDHGFATGDQDVEGLSSDADYITQLGGAGSTITTFRFHPSYQIDLILWRSIMRQVSGAYYFRPGISYDFIRGAFGELFGARLDFIWSRASSFLQTWGNDEDLGIELNAGLYFRSEDGPDPEDGYHARIQYGVLFPMRGLGYYHGDTNLDAAQTLRLILGVVF